MKMPSKKWISVGAAGCGVALIVLVAVKAALARASSTDDLIPVEKLKDLRAPAAAGAAAAPAGPIDLLDLIQPSRDGVAGTWGFHERSLYTPPVRFGRLQVPVVPPEEYDLKFDVTRRRGTECFAIGFVYGGKQGMIILDGFEGTTNWNTLAGSASDGGNETRVVGKQLKWGRPTKVSVFVRKTGVSVTVDAHTVLDWKGSAADLDLDPAFLVPDRKSLMLGTQDTVFRIDEATLTPVTGQPTLLR